MQNFALIHRLSTSDNTLFLEADATFDIPWTHPLYNIDIFLCIGVIPLPQRIYNRMTLSDVPGCSKILLHPTGYSNASSLYYQDHNRGGAREANGATLTGDVDGSSRYMYVCICIRASSPWANHSMCMRGWC